MKVQTNELLGIALDYAVAKSNGWIDYPTDSIEGGIYWHTEPEKAPHGRRCYKDDFNPSVDWYLCGEIIEREDISFSKYHNPESEAYGKYSAKIYIKSGANSYWGSDYDSTGPTALVASLRCYVKSKLGDEVDIPEELL